MTQATRKPNLARLLFALGMGCAAAPACAELDVKFSGFGTLGGARGNHDDAQFRSSVTQATGAGRRLDLGVDSRLAAQGTLLLNDSFSLTTQLLGARYGERDFNLGVEWLYAQYSGSDGLNLKLGRVVLPAFLVSDSRQVGYASPWLRAAPLVYAMMPLSHIDGGQATYRYALGSAVLSAQVSGGSTKSISSGITSLAPGVYWPQRGDNDAKDIWALNGGVEWGSWTLRLSQLQINTHLTVSIYRPASLGGGLAASHLRVFDDNFRAAGLQFDNGSLVLMAEYVNRKTDNEKVQDASSWYLAGGYRISRVMPYLMLSQYRETFTVRGALPPKADGAALGLRWDLMSQVALKAEWARYRNNSTYISTDSVSPGLADKHIKVASLALDFVF